MQEMPVIAYDVFIICILYRELRTKRLRALLRLGKKVREHVPKLHLRE